jgi:transposase
VAETLLQHAQGKAFIADTGYDSERIRAAVKARQMKAVIPSHPTRKVKRRYNKGLYRIRYKVECFFFELKRCRRIATRYEKTGRNYLAFLHLASALIWLG